MMATWTCEVCSITMQPHDQGSHLAGKPHATRLKQIQDSSVPFCVEYVAYFKVWYPERPALPSETSSSLVQLPSVLTPATRIMLNNSSSPSVTASPRATTNNSGNFQCSKPRRRAKTEIRPTTVQTGLLASPAQDVPTTALQAHEFTAEEIAKPQDFIIAQGSACVLVWECKSCNRWMPLSSKDPHLACSTHIARLLHTFSISSPVLTNEQSSTGARLPLSSMKTAQNSSSILHAPPVNPPVSLQEHDSRAERVVPKHKGSCKSKPKSATSQHHSDHSQVLGLPGEESKTKAKSPRSGKTSELAPRFNQKTPNDFVRPGSGTKASNLPKIGPLDRFFRSFPSFPYKPQDSPDRSIQKLLRGPRTWHTWDKLDPRTWKLYVKEVKDKYQAALTYEFNLWFGTDDNLESWHALCRAARVHPPPPTCEGCRLVIRGRHVNIVDLIDWTRKGEIGDVHIFNTVKELSDYSFKNGKIYDKGQLGAGAVLSHLLRELRKARRERA